MAAIDKAEQICLTHYRKPPRIETKSDDTPVTIADRDSEAAMIDIIRKQFPDHGFLGEETGDNSARKEFVWIIDPIDGTKNFIHQIPLWGNLLALMWRKEVVLGISNVPLMRERVWAERDRGAYMNGRRIHVSGTRKIGDATLSYAKSIKLPHDRRDRGILRLMNEVNRQRAFGDLWPYHLLASGRIDIVVEVGIRAYDVAPFVCILPEAGGKSSDLAGKLFTPDIREFLATNGYLHRAALQCFASNKKE
jgi:histidinol-phosphatase